MTSKSKSGYTLEFKIRVLEYYFKNGGKNKFGLKSKTAQLFSIDHKTISRMLCNPDIVKKAQQSLNMKKSSGIKTMKSSVAKIKGKDNSTSKKSSGNATVSSSSTSEELGEIVDRPRDTVSMEVDEYAPKVSVMELPEDPDYSLLKESIGPSSHGANDIAMLLIKGTDEVRQVVTNECELIYECKVCRNLFRSVINFLAHKRLFCQERYNVSQQPFQKDPGPSLVTEPGHTISVSPSPPPPTPPLLVKPVVKPTIESIVSNLSGTTLQANSVATKYSKRLQSRKRNREHLNILDKEPRIYLKPISGVSAAVFQSTAPMENNNENQISNLIDEIASKKRKRLPAVDVSVNAEEGSIEDSNEKEDNFFSCNKCNAQFEEQKLLDVHNEKDHELQRTVYTCPICKMMFLSIGGCVKHLLKIHKKKKHQRDRLRLVIKNRSYTKVLSPSELAQLKNRSTCSNKLEELQLSTKLEEEMQLTSTPESMGQSPSKFDERLTTTQLTKNVNSPSKEDFVEEERKEVSDDFEEEANEKKADEENLEKHSTKGDEEGDSDDEEERESSRTAKAKKILSKEKYKENSSTNMDLFSTTEESLSFQKDDAFIIKEEEFIINEDEFPSSSNEDIQSFVKLEVLEPVVPRPPRWEEMQPGNNYRKPLHREAVYVNKISPKVIAPSLDCRKCGQKLAIPDAINSHIMRCMCVKEQPKKKIEIQVRKDYKKEISPPSSISSNNNSVIAKPKLTNEILMELRKVCNFSSLTCIPCERKYQTPNILKRHIAQHIGWTRFTCANCSFRTYEKYQCLQHCIAAHDVSEKDALELILDDTRLEIRPLKNEVAERKTEEILVNEIHLHDGDKTIGKSSKKDYFKKTVDADIQKPDQLSIPNISEINVVTKSEKVLEGASEEIPCIKDLKKTITIKTVTVKPSEVRPLEVANCNTRNLNVPTLSLKEIVHVKKFSKLELDKQNGEDTINSMPDSNN